MLEDLKNPDKRFPKEMIQKFREHASVEIITSEFSNPNLISFLALENDSFKGFIVGYKKDKYNVYLDYVTGNKRKTKELLLERFISYCKKEKIKSIITDSFEFFDNYKMLLENNFQVFKKENIAPKLEMFWLRLKLKRT